MIGGCMHTPTSVVQETAPTPFHLQDVHLWMRHGEGEHQVLLARADQLEDGDPELAEIERRLAETPDLEWNLTPRGIAQSICAGQWMAKYLLTAELDGEPVVPNGMFDGGYTSPLSRAEQTVGVALIAAAEFLGRTAIQLDEDGRPRMPIDMRLREIDLGEAIGMTKRAYRLLHPDNVARRRVDPLFTAYNNGATIAEHMDLVVRSMLTTLGRDIRTMHTTLGRDAANGSRSALLSTHGRTVRAAALTIRRDHPDDFARIDREEVIDNTTLFITRRTPDSPGFNQFALVRPWVEIGGQIVLNDTPPNWVNFKAPSSRSYDDLLRGLPREEAARLLAQLPQTE
jgi:broad specificity phosphatase PhoE